MEKKTIDILCVEDGSVDLDDLMKTGLQEGKVLVFKQGSREPFTLTASVKDVYKEMWKELKDNVQETLDKISGYYDAVEWNILNRVLKTIKQIEGENNVSK